MKTLIKNGLVTDPCNRVQARLNLLLEDGRFQWKDLEDGHVFQAWSMSPAR